MSVNVYEVITQRILDSLEKGVVPWKMPWRSITPRNLISKKPYRGINVFLLSANRMTSPYWLSFKQAIAKGGAVRKGEKGTPVIFWKITQEDDQARRQFILRYYTVFNLSQCDGISPPPSEEESLDFQPIQTCESIVAGYPHPPVFQEGGNQAAYSPLTDTIQMPPRSLFVSEENYYATLFHEMTHSTGHHSRLDRGFSKANPFGSHAYSQEELVAEMGGAILCGEAGILDPVIDNSVAYIHNWIRRLRDEPKWLIKAGGEAAKAVDLILNRNQHSSEDD